MTKPGDWVNGVVLATCVGFVTLAAQQKPAFEVASVKRSAALDPQKILSGQQRVGMRQDAARVEINNLSLSAILNIAFKTKAYQIKGPAWLVDGPASERFNISATLPQDATSEQVPEMLQALLAERFKMAFHRERHDQNVFALVPAKGGIKMKESAPEDPADKPSPERPPIQLSGNAQSGLTIRGAGAGTTRLRAGPDGTIHLETSRVTMTQLGDMLTRFMDRPVIDMTGLTANYQVSIDISRDDMLNAARSAGVNVPSGAPAGPGAGFGTPASAAADPSGVTLLRSLESLGLKLEAQKQPVEQIIIDQLERTPTDD